MPDIRQRLHRRKRRYGESEPRVRILEMLLSRGADPNQKGPDGMTAIYRAAFDYCFRLVDLLIANGADLNVKHRGAMLLSDYIFYACKSRRHSDRAMLDKLLAAGAKKGQYFS